MSVPVAAFMTYIPHIAKGIFLKYHGVHWRDHPRETGPSKSLAVDDLVDHLKNAHFNQLESLGANAAAIAAATAMTVSPDVTSPPTPRRSGTSASIAQVHSRLPATLS